MSDDATQFRSLSQAVWLRDAEGNAFCVAAETIVGRSPECDLVIADGHASRRHARLIPGAEGLEVEDLGSSNGSFLNGERLQRFVARQGDEVGFDTKVFRVDMGQQVPLEPEADPDATRLHAVAPATPVAAPPVAQPPAAAASSAPEPQADGARPWWQTSDEGPVGTQILRPDQVKAMKPAVSLHVAPPTEPQLVGLMGACAGRTFSLRQDKTVIGRDPDCDIQIDDPGVSSKHAQLVLEEGAWKLVNLLSSNGSFVDGERIQTVFVNSGDELRFGPASFILQLPSAGKTGKGQSKRPLIAAAIGFLVVLGVAAALLL